MRPCANCGFDNPADVALCLSCGLALGAACPVCGHPALPGTPSCGQCGARLPQAGLPARRPRASGTQPLVPDQAALPAGEWHPATVVWASLSAPPHAAAEAVFENLSLLLPRLTALVNGHQGYLIRRPAGLTVVFGAQVAHEDDSVRAVQTALGLLHAFTAPGPEGEPLLAARLAVSAGSVMAGYVGTPAQPEFVVTGEPLLAAQQVAEAVPPGAVWVTTPVRNATNHQFVYAPLSPRAGGLPASLAVWQLEAVREHPVAARGLPGVAMPLIGRETPLEAMLGLAALTLPEGRGGIIWIEGEAGIGKTRLMREFTERLEPMQAQVWLAQCPPSEDARDFALLADLFRRRLGLPNGAPPQDAHARLEAALAAWPPEAAAQRGPLEWLLGLPTAAAQPLAQLPADQRRPLLYTALRTLFKSLAGAQPLMLVLDDFHWVDPPSADLVLFLSNLIAAAPLLLVCALRGDETESSDDRVIKVHSLMRPSQVLRLHLDRLSEAEAERLLGELLADTELPADLRDFVLRRSEGNPFYIEEMVRTLVEQDYLHRRDGRWQIDLSVNLQDLPLPASLGALIQSRVDTLQPEPKYLLQCAAVIGGVFEEGLLASVAALPGVSAALTRLEARGLLRRTARVHLWQFTHALIETAVYATLLPARRQALHQRVAEVLEERWRGTVLAHAAELAYHFAQANAGERALVYLTLAAEEAAGRQANEEALAYFQQAAVLLPSSASPQVTDTLRWRIAVGLGDVYRYLGEYLASQAALEEALMLLARPELNALQHAGLYRRLGETAQHGEAVENSLRFFDLALSALAALEGPEAEAEAARVQAGRALTFMRLGQLALARQAGEAGAAHARRAGSLGELAAAENMLGVIYYQLREWEQASAHTRQAMRLRAQMGDERPVTGTGALRPLPQPAGDWNEARALYERALALRQEIGDEESRDRLERELAALAAEQANAQAAVVAEPDEAAARRLVYHHAHANLNLAGVLLIQGRLEAAAEHAATAQRQVEALNLPELLSEAYRVQAGLHLARQDWEPARAAAVRAAALGAEQSDHSQEAAAWRLLAEIELEQGLVPPARAALDKAWAASRGMISPFEVGRVAAQAGRVSAYVGEMDAARDHLARARAVFAALGARYELVGVEEALRGVG